jgi:DNA-binding MarR family transcriptional regulator/N-acetylglutamate synthase-like GNAT family acetyltransferase
MPQPDLDRQVQAVRRFNRFYTRRIGVLDEGLVQSPFSLAEARVLYELAHRQEPTASELSKELRLDAGYLSRLLRRLEEQGLVERQPAPGDARQSHLRLSRRGRDSFAELDARSHAEVAALLGELAPPGRSHLVQAMGRIESLWGGVPAGSEPYLLRPHQPGDMGWIVHRHGALYAQEYGWNEEFEGLVAGIVAQFLEHFDPKRERCWIAEKDGEIVGSVLLVKKAATISQLRLLLVEPAARGLGLGKRLVAECIRFSRLAGYRKVVLWTNDVLHAARHLYEQAGFRLVKQEPHHSFGHDLVSQTWELTL